jgi:hypothetical protein
MPAWQIPQPQIPDASAHQPFRPKPKALEHAANLPVDPLLEDNSQFRGRDLPHLRGVRAFAIKHNAVDQFLHKIARDAPIQSHFVFLFNFESRLGQTLGKVTIVSQQKQTFALRVEAAHVIERGEFRRQQIENGIARVRIAPGANEPGRLIQRQVKVGALANEPAIHFDVIARRRLKMKIDARFPIHRYTAGRDEVIRSAPGGYARSGKESIETHGRLTRISTLPLNRSLPESNIRLGLRQSDHLAALLPLPALLQQIDPLESLQDIAFRGDGAGAFETAMLRHNGGRDGNDLRALFNIEHRRGELSLPAAAGEPGATGYAMPRRRASPSNPTHHN